MNKQIIGITGKKRAGKDVISNFLTNKYGYQKYSFASPILKMIQVLLNYVDVDVDHYTNINKETDIPVVGASYRKLAQTLGTEWGRTLIDTDLWVKILEFDSQWEDKIVISDVRLNNEAKWVIENGGTIIEVIRDTKSNDSHSSEVGIDRQYISKVIHNNDSLENLYLKVDECLNDHKIQIPFKKTILNFNKDRLNILNSMGNGELEELLHTVQNIVKQRKTGQNISFNITP
jgi:hypothetical protein